MRKLFCVLTLAAMAGMLVGAGQVQADTINYSGTVVEYTVASSGTYEITVAGAQGGGSAGTSGGNGALISGDVFLTAGTQLDVLVGGQGQDGNGPQVAGSGGGGSFVWIIGNTAPLIVAGGGGGAGYAFSNGTDGLTTTAGDNGNGGSDFGAGGTNGLGGGAGVSPGGGNGAGGNGWYGIGGASDNPYTTGGFGGGGNGGFNGGGGGGGYSGGGGGDGNNFSGAGGWGGGGGGSYIDGSFANTSLLAGSNTGDGFVTIGSVPEPSSFAMLGLGGIGLALGAYRRRKAMNL